MCIRKRDIVSYQQYVHDLDSMYQIVSERGKLNHSYNIFMIQILRIRKRETVPYLQLMFMFQIVCIRNRENESYIQYIYDLNCMYQKGGKCMIYTIQLYFIRKRGNYIIPTACFDLVLCISERKKLYYTYSVFMIQTLCI